MAAEAETPAKRPASSDASGETPPPPAKGGHFWQRLPLGAWIAVLLGVSVLFHGFGFLYYQFSGKSAVHAVLFEIPLGDFRFVNEKAEPGSVLSAEFALYITLLDRIDRPAREQLAARQHRVQQDVEQLLRRAHACDFVDPALGDLKRQLQEQINGSLEMRAIGDVIVTNLKLRRSPPEEGPAGTSTGTAASQESPAGNAQAAHHPAQGS
jgi:hypothetical protein